VAEAAMSGKRAAPQAFSREVIHIAECRRGSFDAGTPCDTAAAFDIPVADWSLS